MSLIHLFILLIVMGATCVGPGYFFVRRLRWSAGELLCASVGLSLILIYLIGMAFFILGIDWTWCWVSTVGLAFLTYLSASDFFRRVVRRRIIRQQLLGFGFLLILSLLMLSLIRQYSGGNWVFDWLGHFERAKIFLRLPPFDPRDFVSDPLPTRPPLMNVLAAYFLAHVGAGFDRFQIVFVVLNLLVYLPCILLGQLFSRRGSRSVLAITALLALTPMFFQNVTWAWTKLLTVFFVLLSVALYLRAWIKNDPRRMIGAAVAMAAAVLVHYSAATCAIAMGVHYLLIVRSRRNKFMEISVGILAAALLLATWFGYSLYAFGPQQTLASNTTVAESQQLTAGENAVKIAKNLLANFVPHPLLLPADQFKADFYQPNVLGRWRDYFFLIYQTNLTFAWGLIGWIAILWLWCAGHASESKPFRQFWLLFFLINTVSGVAVIGSPAPFGSAHICLQPLILIGVVFLGSRFWRLPRWMRWTLLMVLIFDVAAGVVLQMRTEMFALPIRQTATSAILPLTDDLLGPAAVRNVLMPQQLQLKFWGEHFAGFNGILYALMAALLLLPLLILARREPRWTLAILAVIFWGFCSLIAVGRFDSMKPSRSDASPAQARYASGFEAYHAGQLERAADDWVTAMLLDPFDLRTRYALNVLLLTHGQRLENTDARYAERVRLNPEDAVAQRALAQQLRARGISP